MWPAVNNRLRDCPLRGMRCTHNACKPAASVRRTTPAVGSFRGPTVVRREARRSRETTSQLRHQFSNDFAPRPCVSGAPSKVRQNAELSHPLRLLEATHRLPEGARAPHDASATSRQHREAARQAPRAKWAAQRELDRQRKSASRCRAQPARAVRREPRRGGAAAGQQRQGDWQVRP